MYTPFFGIGNSWAAQGENIFVLLANILQVESYTDVKRAKLTRIINDFTADDNHRWVAADQDNS